MVAGILSRMTPLPDLFVSSYAAGAVGFGAFFGARCSWSFLPETPSIAFCELLPIVVACHLWGGHWLRLQVHATTQPQCTPSTLVPRVVLASCTYLSSITCIYNLHL